MPKPFFEDSRKIKIKKLSSAPENLVATAANDNDLDLSISAITHTCGYSLEIMYGCSCSCDCSAASCCDCVCVNNCISIIAYAKHNAFRLNREMIVLYVFYYSAYSNIPIRCGIDVYNSRRSIGVFLSRFPEVGAKIHIAFMDADDNINAYKVRFC